MYDSEDCREKYACRHLMKAVALDFISQEENHGPYKLFCDDFGPGNVLVDDSLRVTGVIDWEFCYTAPMQFAGTIPWWLLLQRPHRIINEIGTVGFLDMFLPKAERFLNCLEQKEGASETKPEHRLSARMRKSIEDRSAWFIHAARMVSSVDMIYWSYSTNSAGDRDRPLRRGSTTSPQFPKSIKSARGSCASRFASFRNTIPSLEKKQLSSMGKKGLRN